MRAVVGKHRVAGYQTFLQQFALDFINTLLQRGVGGEMHLRTASAVCAHKKALPMWRQVTENNSYPRARVQLAELLIARGETDGARAVLREVVSDYPHLPAFQRKRDRLWVRRARTVLRKLGG